jgi:hypothetical protein
MQIGPFRVGGYHLALLILLAAFDHAAMAQAPVITGVRVTWYGAFTVGRAKREREPNNALSVQGSKVKPPIVNSEQVALTPDAMFGFGYELAGEPADARIKLRYVIKIPAPGAVDKASGQTKLTDAGDLPNLRLGRGDLFIGESLADFRDPPAGTWTIQLWYGERMLAEKSFMLAK